MYYWNLVLMIYSTSQVTRCDMCCMLYVYGMYDAALPLIRLIIITNCDSTHIIMPCLLWSAKVQNIVY